MAPVATILQWKADGRAEGIAEGMALGMVEARRSDVIRVIRLRFPEAPSDVMSTVRGMSDLDQLGRWLESAVVAQSLDMFRVMANSADSRAAQSGRR
ncbi:hypothetical protein [Fimbriiglobus ruber]|uniref:DUF4351 domain-containing protein n=1 Tax=Fimbriiglobus ruber TaxID=1908690 RepID=A0A225E4J2_9BACT|nr:hypothetical protein [Fimbriiglobus ruber]OWK43605.1 hypothetical protein FRUB_03204 [Fimbriiglobus ruber]